MELEKTSKQELSSLSSLRSITPPNEQGEKNPSEICRIKLINVVHSTILAIKKQDMDSFFFFNLSKQAKRKLILQNFTMKKK
jgi:hypothetical protein